MSQVTSVLLMFSSLEEEENRLSEINKFELENGNNINLESIDSAKLPDAWYGGSKGILGPMYVGSYKNLLIDKFIAYLSENVTWEYFEEVQILVKDERENDEVFRLINMDSLHKS